MALDYISLTLSFAAWQLVWLQLSPSARQGLAQTGPGLRCSEMTRIQLSGKKKLDLQHSVKSAF